MEHTTKIAEAKPFTIWSVEQPANLVVDGKLHTGEDRISSWRAEIEMSSSSLSTKDEYSKSQDRKYSNRKCHENCGCIAHNKWWLLRDSDVYAESISVAAQRIVMKSQRLAVSFLLILDKNSSMLNKNVMNSTGKAREGFLLGYSLKDICCDVKTERVMSTDGGECMGSVSTHEGNSTVTILTIGGLSGWRLVAFKWRQLDITL